MTSAVAIRTDPVAQIPYHVVVQAKRASAEIEVLQKRQFIEPSDEIICLVRVEAAACAPQCLDNPERNACILREDRQLAKPAELLFP
jgi:hypothetical protein